MYQSDAFLEEGEETVRESGARLWVNTLAPHHAAGHTDARAVQDPDAHWGYLIDAGVSIIQPTSRLDYSNTFVQKGYTNRLNTFDRRMAILPGQIIQLIPESGNDIFAQSAPTIVVSPDARSPAMP